MDTNTVEREIRPVAVKRKAALTAGSEAILSKRREHHLFDDAAISLRRRIL
jgi:hypothetical protein